MFGVSRRTKPRPGRARSPLARSPSPSSSSDGEGDARRRRAKEGKEKKKKRKKKKKKTTKKDGGGGGGAPALSFDPDEGGDDDDDEGEPSRKKDRKRKRKDGSKRRGGLGLGYGGSLGLGAASVAEEDADEPPADDVGEGGDGGESGVDTGSGRGGGSRYDVAALARLRAEQRGTPGDSSGVVRTTPAEEASRKQPATDGQAQPTAADEGEGGGEEEYISLSGAAPPSSGRRVPDPMVLTGDEALAHVGEDDDGEFDHGLGRPLDLEPSNIVSEKGASRRTADPDLDQGMGGEPAAEKEDRRWEDAVARRAGALPPKSGPRDDGGSGRGRHGERGGGDVPSLSKMRASLVPAAENLSDVRTDMESGLRRRTTELSAAQEELKRQKVKLEEHGEALEYYQVLREELATWMGALRELDGAVVELEKVRDALSAEATWGSLERRREWAKDCAKALEGRGLTIGRAEEGGECSNGDRPDGDAPQVDEFGRDLASLASMARVGRWRRRRERRLARLRDGGAEGDDDALRRKAEGSNEDNFDPPEREAHMQRKGALAKAVALVPSLAKDEYLSLSGLRKLFLDWHGRRPEDYASCYADMSLVQMASVLVRLEMCDRWEVFYPSAPSSGNPRVELSEMKWFRELEEGPSRGGASDGEEGRAAAKATSRDGFLREMIQKHIVDRLCDSFQCEDERRGTYDPFSTSQTEHFCSLLKSALGYFSDPNVENGRVVCSEITNKVLKALLSSIKCHVERMALPVVDPSKVTMIGDAFCSKGGLTETFNGEIADALVYATAIQTKEHCTLVKNILGCWYPAVNRGSQSSGEGEVASLVRFVFDDLVAVRILPVLHSLHEMNSGGCQKDSKSFDMSKSHVDGILAEMQAVGLLNTDEWMLMAAPLRSLSDKWDDNTQE